MCISSMAKAAVIGEFPRDCLEGTTGVADRAAFWCPLAAQADARFGSEAYDYQ